VLSLLYPGPYTESFGQKEFDVGLYNPKLLSKVANAACKLRYADLFRECLILLAGNWDDKPDLSGYDPKIGKLIMAARNRIGYEIARVSELIQRFATENSELDEEFKKVRLDGHVTLAGYYRDLYCGQGSNGEVCDYGEFKDNIAEALETLMENNLKIYGNDDFSGRDPFAGYFLCAIIDDDDLPWDRTQTDW
jgi:hypothetical protein